MDLRAKARRLLTRPHDCWPPRGAVFDSLWTCPGCGAVWELVEHALHSEWVRQESST